MEDKNTKSERNGYQKIYDFFKFQKSSAKETENISFENESDEESKIQDKDISIKGEMNNTSNIKVGELDEEQIVEEVNQFKLVKVESSKDSQLSIQEQSVSEEIESHPKLSNTTSLEERVQDLDSNTIEVDVGVIEASIPNIEYPLLPTPPQKEKESIKVHTKQTQTDFIIDSELSQPIKSKIEEYISQQIEIRLANLKRSNKLSNNLPHDKPQEVFQGTECSICKISPITENLFLNFSGEQKMFCSNCEAVIQGEESQAMIQFRSNSKFMESIQSCRVVNLFKKNDKPVQIVFKNEKQRSEDPAYSNIWEENFENRFKKSKRHKNDIKKHPMYKTLKYYFGKESDKHKIYKFLKRDDIQVIGNKQGMYGSSFWNKVNKTFSKHCSNQQEE